MLRSVGLGISSALAILAVASAQTLTTTGQPDVLVNVQPTIPGPTPPGLPPDVPGAPTPPPLPGQPNLNTPPPQPQPPSGAVNCPQGNQLCSIRAQMFCYNPELLNCVPFQAAVVGSTGVPDPSTVFNDNMLCPRSLDASCNGLCFNTQLLDCDQGVLKDKEGRRIDLATGTPVIEGGAPAVPQPPPQPQPLP